MRERVWNTPRARRAAGATNEMGVTLLLADDSVTMRRVVELTFAEQGFKVVSVSDGQQAVDYISRQDPALALVSASLPKVNGFDVARYVRDHVQRRVPVLLLAGAFDNLDEAQVRESGASGVLVKPFEPAVVIKRVKELLGMKPEEPRATPVRPPASSSSGRLFTSSEGPTRTPPAAGPTPSSIADSPAPVVDEAWQRLRDTSGLGGDAQAVEGQAPTGEYLDHLDAAFDSLDAQLAGRPAPSGRATHAPPAPTMPAAIDPGRRPVAPAAFREGPGEGDVPSPPAQPAGKPVYEVDDNWFDKKPTVADSLGDLTEFVVTRAGDFSAPPQPAAPPSQDRSWLPSGLRHEPADSVPQPSTTDVDTGASTPPSAYTATPVDLGARTSLDTSAVPDVPGAPDTLDISSGVSGPGAPSVAGALSAPSAPTPSGASPADAFAMLWAQEQGEPLPPPAAAPPIDLSDQAVDALTSQLTDRVAARVGDPLAHRLVEDLGGRLTAGIADRLVGDVADRLITQLPVPIAAGVSERIASAVADRVSAAVADRVVATVAERVTSTVADRVAAGIDSMHEPITRSLSNVVGERVVNVIGERIPSDLAARVSTDLAPRVTEQMGPQVVEQLAPRLLEALAPRLVDDLAPRVTADLAPRVTADLAPRLTEDLAPRLVNDLVARLGPPLLDRLTNALGERLSAGLTERVSELVAERALQSALGESLRQTVSEVAERVVRAEVERIKSAAEALRR